MILKDELESMKIKLTVKQSRYEANMRKQQQQISEMKDQLQDNNRIISELRDSISLLKFSISDYESKLKCQELKIKQLTVNCHKLEFENKSFQTANKKL